MRPFRLDRDLAPLADLIELAFKDELERTGNRVVVEMRRLAKLGPLLWLAGGGDGFVPALMDGYVWIVDDKLVGNASLTRESGASGLFSVSNVAVLPAYRRQGIARRLMDAVIRRAIERGARRLILEVNAGNDAARQLYRSLGFALYDTRHELLLPRIRWPQSTEEPTSPLRPWRPDDAHQVQALARAATPNAVQQVHSVSKHRRRMASDDRLSAFVGRLLRRSVRRAWVWPNGQSIVAALQIRERHWPDAHQVGILVHPLQRGQVERALLERTWYELSRFQLDLQASVSESHPQALVAFKGAGFESRRVLARMTMDLRAMNRGVVL